MPQIMKSVPAEQLDAILKQNEDMKAMLAQFKAQGEENRRLMGTTPTAFYKNKADREEKIERAHHVVKLINASLEGQTALHAVMDEKPEWYTSHTAFSGAADGTGGFTMPVTWSDQIFSNIDEFGYARKIAHVIDMPTRDIKFNTGTAVTVSWPGEDTAVTPFDAAGFFTQVTMSAKTLAAAAIIGKDLTEDTAVAILDYLTLQYKKAVSKEEDKQYFNGTGSPFTGLVSTIVTHVVTMSVGNPSFSNVTWKDMVNLKLAVNPDVQNKGVYTVAQDVFGALSKDVDTNGRPIYYNEQPHPNQNNTGINQAPWIYNGSPMWVLPNGILPTTGASRCGAIFGDHEDYGLFGVRREMGMETYNQAYAGVDLSGKRMIAIAVTERIGIAFPDETAFAKLVTSAS